MADSRSDSPAESRQVKEWARRPGDFVPFLLRSALVGIGAGLVAVAFRLVLSNAEWGREQVLAWGHGIPGLGWLALPVAGGVAGALAGWLTGFAPETAGSGIPHVEAVLNHERDLKWWRLIPVKFAAGTLAIGAGFSLGREGPTVQMGAAVAQAVSGRVRVSRAEELQLVACGAGAGLAAAFNAPLAGVVFVLEELRRNFSPYVLGGAFAASIAADIVSLLVVGPLPTFRVGALQMLPLRTLPLFLVLGVVAGALGALFNRCLQGSLDAADRLATTLPRWARAGATGFLAGLLGYVLPQVLGGGHGLVMALLSRRAVMALGATVILFGAKFLLTMVSYGAGVPGGIFLPLLTLGALLGAIVGGGGSVLFPALPGLLPSLIVVGMAAYFVAIVRAPLTGIVLLTEMTGRYQHMLPLLLSCIAAYVVAEALGSPPVYEALLEREHAKGSPVSRAADDTAVIELAVETGAAACGCLVRDLSLPPDCLLVSVQKGSREVIPRGHTRLAEGDILRVIVPADRAAEIRDVFARLACCRMPRPAASE